MPAFLDIQFNNSLVYQLISQFTISPFLLTKHDYLLIQFFPYPVRWWDQTPLLTWTHLEAPQNHHSPTLECLLSTFLPCPCFTSSLRSTTLGQSVFSSPPSAHFTVSEQGGFGSWVLFQLEHTQEYLTHLYSIKWPLLAAPVMSQSNRRGQRGAARKKYIAFALKPTATVWSQNGKCLSCMKYSWFLHTWAHKQHTNAASCVTTPPVQSQTCLLCPVSKALA